MDNNYSLDTGMMKNTGSMTAAGNGMAAQGYGADTGMMKNTGTMSAAGNSMSAQSYGADSGMTKNTGSMTAAGNGTAQNFTTQTWGNQVPFSDTQLQSMSGMQTAMPPQSGSTQMMDSSMIMPETLTNPIYTPGYLRTQLGKWMRVEFLFGNNTTDRVGRLVEVGASYIILQSLEANSRMLCDIYSIRFVTIINNAQTAALYDTVYSS